MIGLGAALLVLFFASVPIFAAFLICNIGAMYLLAGKAGFGMFVNSATSTATSIPLVSIPLFVLMGELLSRASAIDQLMRAVDTLVGAIRGRLYVLTIAISTILAALSGSAMASAAMLGRSVIPLMLERGYDRKMTFGAAMGGACLAPIIPPSIFAILIGTLAQVSIGDLFIAGVIPGIMLALGMLVYIFGRIVLDRTLAPIDADRKPVSGRDVLGALAAMLPFTAVIGFVMGSILLGFATPSESGALGVVGAAAVAAVHRRLSLGLILSALRGTAMVTGMIIVVLISSQLFSQLLAFSGTSRLLHDFVGSLEFPPLLMLAIMLAIPFFMCMFLDEIAVMLILIPIYSPLLGTLGFDPIWFWTLFLINLTLGAISPPVGYVLYILQGVVPRTRLSELFVASVPYVFIYLAAMIVVAQFPWMVTALLF